MRSQKDRSRSFSSCFADAASLCTKTKLGSSCVRRIILHACSVSFADCWLARRRQSWKSTLCRHSTTLIHSQSSYPDQRVVSSLFSALDLLLWLFQEMQLQSTCECDTSSTFNNVVLQSPPRLVVVLWFALLSDKSLMCLHVLVILWTVLLVLILIPVPKQLITKVLVRITPHQTHGDNFVNS